VTRRSDQLNRIEASLARLEEALSVHVAFTREQTAAVRAEVKNARSSAEAAHAGVQALADMLPLPFPQPDESQAIPPASPEPPSAVTPAAGGGAEGEPAPSARRADKTLKPKGM
jgi:hypothetical protein